MKSLKAKTPKIGEFYDCFDDGKVTSTRKYKVEITNLFSFEEMPDEAKWLWDNNLSNPNFSEPGDYCLFAPEKEQDVIVQGISYEQKDEPMVCYFARTSGGGWFGLGNIGFNKDTGENYYSDFWCSGRLDWDKSLWDWYLNDIGMTREEYNLKFEPDWVKNLCGNR